MSIAIPPLVSIDETRRLLGGRGRGYVYGLLKTGELESITDEGRRLVTGDSIARYVDSLIAKSSASK